MDIFAILIVVVGSQLIKLYILSIKTYQTLYVNYVQWHDNYISIKVAFKEDHYSSLKT